MKPNYLRLLRYSFLLSIVLTACSFNGMFSSDQSEELRSMADVIWVLKSFGPSNNLTTALPQPQITLKFDFDSKAASGSAGCNNYSAGFTLRNTNLSIEQAMSTLMACVDNQAMQQETNFMMLLSKVVSYQIGGNSLILFTETGETLHFQTSQK